MGKHKQGARATGYPLEDRIEFQGLQISIENKKGSIRRGVDPDGSEWVTRMNYPYGYIRGTVGADGTGDHVDVYVGPNPKSTHAYIVHQCKPDTGEYDEDKVMLGFDSVHDAQAAYLSQYDDPRFLGSIQPMDMNTFRGKVLYRENWGEMVKAEEEKGETDQARALLAQLGGELLKTDVQQKRNRENIEALRAGHTQNVEALAPALRDYRRSPLSKAYLDHAAEAHRARALQAANAAR